MLERSYKMTLNDKLKIKFENIDFQIDFIKNLYLNKTN